MSGLLGKVAGQLSGQQSSQSSSGSSGLMHKMTDVLTGQKHPQDTQSYQHMYGNNTAARPYHPENYPTGQYIGPEGQGHYEPHYEEGQGNPNGGFRGHNNGPGFYPNDSSHGCPSGHAGYGGPVGYRREYSFQQAGYAGNDAPVGYSNQVEHGEQYPQSGHKAIGSYDGHGDYRGGHNSPFDYGGGYHEHVGFYNNRGYGGYEGGHGQPGGTNRVGR